MNRPIYENAVSVRAEDSLADSIRAKLLPGWELVKLPIKYKLDYAAVDDQGVVRKLYELKCRNYTMDSFFTYMLSADKYIAAKQYARDLNVPCSLIVRWKDCDGWVNLRSCDYTVRIGGRTDRNDPQDIEPVVHIPIHDFHIIE